MFLAWDGSAVAGQVITGSADGTLAEVLANGALLPANASVLSGAEVHYRLRCGSKHGYRIDASAAFGAIAAAPIVDGATISASDVGVGITSIVTPAGVDKPRRDSIEFGFDYDPTTVNVSNGLTPYRGAAQGQATVADLANGRKIQSGPRIAGNENSRQSGNYLAVTMKFGILPQYFTPGSFTATVTLTISEGL